MPSRYDAIHARSICQPAEFWAEAAERVHFYRRWDRVLDDRQPPLYRWFVGAEVNTCYNAVDRHVENGRAEQVAIFWDSPLSGQKRALTYRQLQGEVATLAGALRRLGVDKGDRVLIYMPNMPEAVIAVLACARLGAVHSVVFGGFAPHELASRIEDATPKVLLCSSCGIEPGRVIAYKPLIDSALKLTRHQPKHVVVFSRPQATADLVRGRDLDWQELCAGAPQVDCVKVLATDPLYILYTSGTTGKPKGIVRDNGGHLVALSYSMDHIYGVKPGEVFWAASDIGWAVGHSYMVYGPLFHGCTTVVYEGKPVGTPDAGALWRVISEYKVAVFFTAPTAIRAVKREDPRTEHLARYDTSCLRTLFLAGERADPDTIKWAEQALKIPVIDHFWQTESGWPMAANCLGIEPMPVKYGSPTKAVPGYDIRVVDDQGQCCAPGQSGAIVVKLPLPPGTLPTLWNNESGYISGYLSHFPGYYETADAGYLDAQGYLFVMSRTDDVINVAGHRLATGAMEEVLSGHAAVAECAVIGVPDDLKGQVPLGFVVLKAGVSTGEAQLVAELCQRVREHIGPVAAFKLAAVVPRLPKTRSGKVLRGTMRRIAAAAPWQLPATIEDPATLDGISAALQRLGYPKKP